MGLLKIVSCLSLLLMAEPSVELVQLDGQQETVKLKTFDADSVSVVAGDDEKTVPLKNLLSLNFTTSAKPVEEPVLVTLRDNSLLSGSKVQVTPRKLTMMSATKQDIALPKASVSHIRFAPLEEVVKQSWTELTSRENKSDLVVVRKGDVLDQIKAVIGEIKEQEVHLILGKREVDVPLEKVFGLIYAAGKQDEVKTLGHLRLINQDQLAAKKIKWTGEDWLVDLALGGRVKIGTDQLQQIDFSQGKIAYLSDLEPVDLRYQPFFDVTWKYHRDQNGDGQSLSLAQTAFRKGLWLHSHTELTYRLARKYRRFQAVVGIDDAIAREASAKNKGKVQLTIEGNGKELFSQVIRPDSAPAELDLDVSDILNLKITVGYADDLDIADHLILGNARVLK